RKDDFVGLKRGAEGQGGEKSARRPVPAELGFPLDHPAVPDHDTLHEAVVEPPSRRANRWSRHRSDMSAAAEHATPGPRQRVHAQSLKSLGGPIKVPHGWEHLSPEWDADSIELRETGSQPAVRRVSSLARGALAKSPTSSARSVRWKSGPVLCVFCAAV